MFSDTGNPSPRQGRTGNSHRTGLETSKVREITSALRDRGAEVVRHLLPNARLSGHYWLVGSVQGEKGESLKINAQSWRWQDYAAGKGRTGDLLDLWSEVRNLTGPELYQEAAAWAGVELDKKRRRPVASAAPLGGKPEPILADLPALKAKAEKPQLVPVVPVPDDAPPRPGRHCEHEATYYDTAGNLIGYVRKVRRPNGKKECLPLTLWRQPDGRMTWEQKGFQKPYPLFRLPELIHPRPVLLVEGEAKAEIAADNLEGFVVVSWLGGTGTVEHADLTPLQGRDVTVWPDNDDPGREAAQKMAARLQEIGAASVRIVDVPAGLPEGWDLGDIPTKGGMTWEQVDELLARAQETDEPISDRARYLLERTLTGDDFEPSLDRPYLIKGVLQADNVSMIFGASGCCKTFVTLDMALHVSAGREWYGHRVKQAGVLYLCSEGGAEEAKARVKAARKAKGFSPADPFALVPCSVNLLDPNADTRPIVELARHFARKWGVQVGMIVVDTLARAMPGGDENAGSTVSALYGNIEWIKERAGGPNIVLVHHSGKDAAKGARGHSGLPAAVDTWIEVTKEKGLMDGSLYVGKQRGAAESTLTFTVEVVELGIDTEGDPITSLAVTSIESGRKAVPDKPIPPTPAQATALRVLANLMNERQVVQVHVDEWRARLKSHTTLLSDKANPTTEWRRISNGLLDKGLIYIENNQVRLTELAGSYRSSSA